MTDDTTPGSCAGKIAAKKTSQLGPADAPAFILNMSRWQQIVDFCDATGIQLVFCLNGNTRTNHGPIDWVNIRFGSTPWLKSCRTTRGQLRVLLKLCT